MKVQLRMLHKVVILVIVPVFCSWIFAGILFNQLQVAEQEAYREGHAKAITAECNLIIPLFYNAGTSLFGWVHTKQHRFFDNYKQATREIRSRIATLELLCATDPTERSRMQNISKLVTDELNLLDSASSGASMNSLQKEFQTASTQLIAEVKEFAASESDVAASVPDAEERSHATLMALLMSFIVMSSVVAFALALAFNRSTVARLNILLQNSTRLSRREALLPQISGADEIAHLDAVMHDSAAALDQAARRKEEITSMVSHDLRTPLMNIQTVMTMMRTGVYGDLSDKANNAVERAEANTGQLIRLINDLLDVDRIESGRLPILRQEIKLEEVFQRARENIVHFSADRDVDVDFESTNVVVNADADRLVQVLTNLVSNAVKFSPPNSTVKVCAEQSADGVEVSIVDNGRGIPNEFLPKLFNRFQQVLHEDAAQGRGSGLGLSIAKAIVESHDGTIGVESEVGSGSRFWFRLPMLSVAMALVACTLTGCTKSTDYFGLRCWERACISGDEAWRQGRRDAATNYYSQATRIAQSKNLGADRIALSSQRVSTMQAVDSIDGGNGDVLNTDEDRIQEAKELIAEKKLADAAAVLQAVLQSAPSQNLAQRLKIAELLGGCYNKLGKPDKTIEVVTPIVHEKLVENCTDYMRAMTNLYRALSAQKKFATAEEECTLWLRVLEADPMHKPSDVAWVQELQARAHNGK